MSQWTLRELREENNTCHPEAIRLQPPSMVSPGKHRILVPESWDAYERNDFWELRLLHLLIHRKTLNFLTWDIWVSESRSVISDSLQPHGLYCPWNSPGQNTGVGSCSFLQGILPTQGSNPGLPHQGILPTQGSNPGLPHCRQILYQLCFFFINLPKTFRLPSLCCKTSV